MSMVFYNPGFQTEEMSDDDDLSSFGDAVMLEDVERAAEDDDLDLLNPSDMFRSLLADKSEEEIAGIINSDGFIFNYSQDQLGSFPPSRRASIEHSSPSTQCEQQLDDDTFLNDVAFPDVDNELVLHDAVVTLPVIKKRRPVPEDQRPRRIPGLVKQGNPRSSLVAVINNQGNYESQHNVTVDHIESMDITTQGNYEGGVSMTPPMTTSNSVADLNQGNFDELPSLKTMDVTVGGSPHDVAAVMPSNGEPQESLQLPTDLKSYNDAMEKLCESMKRSAMSRLYVKQLSGRSLQDDESSRSGSIRSGSPLNTMTANLQNSSTHCLSVVSQQSSECSVDLAHGVVQQQGSVRSLNDNGRSTVSTKPSLRRHSSVEVERRIGRAPPSRGLFRHKSANARLMIEKEMDDDLIPFDAITMELGFDENSLEEEALNGEDFDEGIFDGDIEEYP